MADLNIEQLRELLVLGFISEAEFLRRSQAPATLTVEDFCPTTTTMSVTCTCEQSCGAPDQCLRCGCDVIACNKERHIRSCRGLWDVLVPCPCAWQGCDKLISRSNWSQHVEHECEFAEVLCKCVVDDTDTRSDDDDDDDDDDDEPSHGICLKTLRRGELAAHMAVKHRKQTASFCRQVAFEPAFANTIESTAQQCH